MRSLAVPLLPLSACATFVPITSEPDLRAEAFERPAALSGPTIDFEAAKAAGVLDYLPASARDATNGYWHCLTVGQRSANLVTVGFDILPNGEPANLEILSSTDPCYDPFAARAVAVRRARPVVIDGVPHTVTGASNSIHFNFSG